MSSVAEEIRCETGLDRQAICDLCGGVRHRGWDPRQGNEALTQFLRGRKKHRPIPDESFCKGCPLDSRQSGRPGIGHDKNVTFGERAYNNGRVDL